MACDLDTIALQLLASYHDVGGINHVGGSNLPSRDAMPAICAELLQLCFPGFFDAEPLTTQCVENRTRRVLDSVMARLSTEVARSLRCQAADEDCAETKTRGIVCRFLRQLPVVRQLLLTDVEAAYAGDPAARSYEEIILSYPCMEAIAIQRLAHVLYLEQVPLLPRMMTEWAHSRTGIDIHPGARIGSHFFIDHGTGVVIGETCVIGHHVKLYHGVTLGARSFEKDGEGNLVKGNKRHPEVEDHVTIYPNATILGGDTVIGHHSTIGANAFIMSSIAPESLVALSPQDHRILDKRQKPRLSPTPA